MSWVALATNQGVSFNDLQDAVNTSVFTSTTSSIPVSNQLIQKSQLTTYINNDTTNAGYIAASNNQILVKSTITAPPNYTISFQWRIAAGSSGTPIGKIAYSTNSGTSWTMGSTTTLGTGGSYTSANPSSISVSNNSSLWIGVLNSSAVNTQFNVGNGLAPSSVYCGESSPYKFTITSSTTVYLNVVDNGSGTLTTC